MRRVSSILIFLVSNIYVLSTTRTFEGNSYTSIIQAYRYKNYAQNVLYKQGLSDYLEVINKYHIDSKDLTTYIQSPNRYKVAYDTTVIESVLTEINLI